MFTAPRFKNLTLFFHSACPDSLRLQSLLVQRLGAAAERGGWKLESVDLLNSRPTPTQLDFLSHCLPEHPFNTVATSNNKSSKDTISTTLPRPVLVDWYHGKAVVANSEQQIVQFVDSLEE